MRAMHRSPEELQWRIDRYEGLIQDQLKHELTCVLDKRDEVFEKIAQCLELRNNMKSLLEQQTCTFKAMVDLGSNTYVQAVVPNTLHVYVSVGLGFHAQMTLQEAIDFATKREAALSIAAEMHTQRAALLKAKIKLAIGALDELVRTREASSV